MKKILGAILFMFLPLALYGQDIVKTLKTNKSGQGRVTIYQSSAIDALIGRADNVLSEENKSAKKGKAVGYRVMLYAGNNSRVSRSEAESVAKQVKEMFPEAVVYVRFSSPRWLCQLGDFRNIEEADAWMRKINATGKFKEMSIVKEQINVQF
ncbi:MAG TPA: SPOR domain-containing protein [Candidatus Avibacteroides excrementipullorum]|nr:SPOR domain-containing protein [Candidatus Avibacteroides excrementipullorum]